VRVGARGPHERRTNHPWLTLAMILFVSTRFLITCSHRKLTLRCEDVAFEGGRAVCCCYGCWVRWSMERAALRTPPLSGRGYVAAPWFLLGGVQVALGQSHTNSESVPLLPAGFVMLILQFDILQ
jgi:hypothetical protein